MPTVCFVIPCMGRLGNLQKILGSVVAQPDSSCVVVDYSCPERTGDWVASHYPQVRVVRVDGQTRFNKPRALNEGSRACDSPWICFCDADILLHPSFGADIFPLLRPGHYYRGPLLGLCIFGTMICSRPDFNRAGGYDEVYKGWGSEDDDMYAALDFVGSKAQDLSPNLMNHLPHSEESRVQYYDIKNREITKNINGIYRRVKFDIMLAINDFLPRGTRERMYEKILEEVYAALRDRRNVDLRLDVPTTKGSVTWSAVVEVPASWTPDVQPPTTPNVMGEPGALGG